MGGFSGGAMAVHRYELAASGEVVISTVLEWMNVHAEFRMPLKSLSPVHWQAFSTRR
jgi:hypothetical protein